MLIGINQKGDVEFESTDERLLSVLEKKLGRKPTVQDFCPPGNENNLTSIHMSKQEYQEFMEKKGINKTTQNNNHIAISV